MLFLHHFEYCTVFATGQKRNSPQYIGMMCYLGMSDGLLPLSRLTEYLGFSLPVITKPLLSRRPTTAIRTGNYGECNHSPSLAMFRTVNRSRDSKFEKAIDQ